LLVMTDVTATASGGTTNYGVYNIASSPAMTNIHATGSGGTNNYGMWNDSASPTIRNSIISASGGTVNDGIHSVAASGAYLIIIDASQITGSPSTIYQDGPSIVTRVGASQLAGAGAFSGPAGGTYVCAFSYNGNYGQLGTDCK
jgi:hypothetical protein